MPSSPPDAPSSPASDGLQSMTTPCLVKSGKKDGNKHRIKRDKGTRQLQRPSPRKPPAAHKKEQGPDSDSDQDTETPTPAQSQASSDSGTPSGAKAASESRPDELRGSPQRTLRRLWRSSSFCEVRRRQPSKKVSPNAQGSPHTPSLPVSFLLEVNPQPIESIADSNIEVGTSESTPIAGCLPSESWTPTTFVYENQKLASHDTPGATVTPTGKLPRSRHRMTSDKLETLDAFFRRNTHPSRKEKEAICKDLDM
ncbi:hypothetical protein EI94DRAFT_1747686 [Lactarius quietus]|nr:hypothetical protein EI94DRAFT_1747686 [Lactarius quietus]